MVMGAVAFYAMLSAMLLWRSRSGHARKRGRFLFLVCTALSSPGTDAAENEWGAWLIASKSGTLSTGDQPGPWRYGLQVQGRYFDRLDGVGQFIVRPGIAWRMNSKVTFWGGYAYYYTDVRNAGTRNEHRLWQQINWNMYYWGSTTLKSRTRLEQRFINERDGTGVHLRQQVRLDAPFKSNQDINLILGAEVFYNLRDTSWAQSGYAQSRAFAGLGFDIGLRTIETGYMYNHNRIRGLPDLVNHLFILNIKL